jgi:hypothetical protein
MASMAVLPTLLALAACGIFLVPRARWVTVFALLLVAAMAASFFLVWLTWGWGFDYVDANRPVPASIDRTMTAAGLAFGACYVLFLATSLLTAVSAWRRRRDSAGQWQVVKQYR